MFLDLCVEKAEVIDLSQTVLRDIVDVKPINHEVNIKTLCLNEMRNHAMACTPPGNKIRNHATGRPGQE